MEKKPLPVHQFGFRERSRTFDKLYKITNIIIVVALENNESLSLYSWRMRFPNMA